MLAMRGRNRLKMPELAAKKTRSPEGERSHKSEDLSKDYKVSLHHHVDDSAGDHNDFPNVLARELGVGAIVLSHSRFHL